MFSLPSATVIRRLFIALAVLAGVAFAPGRAAAGCGDYDMSDMPPGVKHLAGDHGSTPDKPVCHGPNCSKKPIAPAPLPKVPVPVPTGDDLTGFLIDTQLFSFTSRPFPAEQSARPSIGLTDAIYHPPR